VRLAPPDRVLLRLPSRLGDFVMAEPAARAVVEAYADAGCVERVTLCAPGRLLALFEGCFEGARRLPLAGREDPAQWRGQRVALFFNGSLGSVLTACRARIPHRVGWSSGGRGPFLSLAIRRSRELGPRRRLLGRALPRPFGCDCRELVTAAGIAVRASEPRLFSAARARERVAERLSAAGVPAGAPVVVVNAGSRPGSAKAYPDDAWAAAIAALAQSAGHPTVVVAGPGEEERGAAVAALAGRSCRAPVVEARADLLELAAWAARASLFVCADGGARHVAKAVGARTLVLFGPTDPRHTAEHMEREARLAVPVPCGPCHRERCPLEGAAHHACMRGIQPRDVAGRAARMLAGGA